MFDRVAHSYDRLNHLLSAGLDRRWRARAVRELALTGREDVLKYETLQQADRLAWQLQQLPEVQATISLPDVVRQITAGSFEGSPMWLTLSRNQDILNYGGQQATVNNPELFNTECSVMPVITFLKDHKAATLDKVSTTVEKYISEHPVTGVELLPGQYVLVPPPGQEDEKPFCERAES